jgi:hypothetical protein
MMINTSLKNSFNAALFFLLSLSVSADAWARQGDSRREALAKINSEDKCGEAHGTWDPDTNTCGEATSGTGSIDVQAEGETGTNTARHESTYSNVPSSASSTNGGGTSPSTAVPKEVPPLTEEQEETEKECEAALAVLNIDCADTAGICEAVAQASSKGEVQNAEHFAEAICLCAFPAETSTSPNANGSAETSVDMDAPKSALAGTVPKDATYNEYENNQATTPGINSAMSEIEDNHGTSAPKGTGPVKMVVPLSKIVDYMIDAGASAKNKTTTRADRIISNVRDWQALVALSAERADCKTQMAQSYLGMYPAPAVAEESGPAKH